jgi:hypothetical protein
MNVSPWPIASFAALPQIQHDKRTARKTVRKPRAPRKPATKVVPLAAAA